MKDPWILVLIVIIGIAITLVAIFVAWLKGEFKKLRPYPYHHDMI